MVENDKKYIKQLVLSNSSGEHILNFKPGVNVIIGTKGGGKSSLLKILYAMHANYSNDDKDIEDTAKVFGFNIDKIVYSNNDTKLWKDKRTKYTITEHRDDIVVQNDRIKTQLDTAKNFEKEKQKFLLESCKFAAEDLKKFFKGYFTSFYDTSESFKALHEFNINDLFKLKNVKNKHLLEQIQKLLHSSLNTKKQRLNDAFIERHSELYNHLKIYLYKIKKYNNEFNEIEFISSEEYQKISDAVLTLLRLHASSITERSLDNVKYKAAKLTNEYYTKRLQESQDTDRRIASFSASLKNYFENIAKSIATNFAYFDNFLDEKFSQIPISNKGESKIDPDIRYEINIKYDLLRTSEDGTPLYEFLKKFLYTPSGTDLTNKKNWLNRFLEDNSFKNDIYEKEHDDPLLEKLKEHFQKALKNKVTVLLDGSNYEKLSLGTRSSYGVSRVIRNCKSPILFLDQPEDNIDSYTIAKTLIPEIEKNPYIKQLFIVTHNSNTGILTNPSTTTVCSFRTNDIKNSYRQSNLGEQLDIIEDEIVNENPSAHYLEGGIQAFKKRHKILIKQNGDDNNNE